MVPPTALESPHGAVGKTTSFLRSRGYSDRVGVHFEPSGSFAQRRVSGDRTARVGRTSSGRAVHEPAPSFVRPVSALRAAGLVSCGVLNVIGFGVAAVGRPSSRRFAGGPSCRGSFGRRGLARARSAPGVPRWVRGTRRLVVRATVLGVGNGARRRAAWRVARTSSFSRTWSSPIVHSNGRPTSKWSRRARRSGAILSPTARGSFATLYGQKTKDFGSVFHPGRLRLLGVHRGVVLLRDPVVARGRGARFGVVISVAATSKEQEHLAAAAIGLIWVTSASSSNRRALSGSGARPCVVEHRRFLHRSNVRGRAVAGGRVEGCADGQHSGVVRFRRCGAALGVVRRAGAIARVSIWGGLIRGAV